MSSVAERIAALKKKEQEQKQARENPNPKALQRSKTNPDSTITNSKVESFRTASSVRLSTSTSTSTSAFGKKKNVRSELKSAQNATESTEGGLKSKIAALERKASQSSTSPAMLTEKVDSVSNQNIKGKSIEEPETENKIVKKGKSPKESVGAAEGKGSKKEKEKEKDDTKEKPKKSISPTKSERESLLENADFTRKKGTASEAAKAKEVVKNTDKAKSEKGDGPKIKPELKKGNSIQDRIRQMQLDSEEQKKKGCLLKTRERPKSSSSVAEKLKALQEKSKSDAAGIKASKTKVLSSQNINNSVSSRLNALKEVESNPSSSSVSNEEKITSADKKSADNQGGKDMGKPNKKVGSKIQSLTGKMQIPIPLPGMGMPPSLARNKNPDVASSTVSQDDTTDDEPKAIRHLSLTRPRMKSRGRRRPKSLKAVVHNAKGTDGVNMNTLASLVQSLKHEQKKEGSENQNTAKAEGDDGSISESTKAEDDDAKSGNNSVADAENDYDDSKGGIENSAINENDGGGNEEKEGSTESNGNAEDRGNEGEKVDELEASKDISDD